MKTHPFVLTLTIIIHFGHSAYSQDQDEPKANPEIPLLSLNELCESLPDGLFLKDDRRQKKDYRTKNKDKKLRTKLHHKKEKSYQEGQFPQDMEAKTKSWTGAKPEKGYFCAKKQETNRLQSKNYRRKSEKPNRLEHGQNKCSIQSCETQSSLQSLVLCQEIVQRFQHGNFTAKDVIPCLARDLR